MAKYKCGDHVFFHLNDRKYEYSVTSNFLHNCGGDNAEIFTDLGMDEQAKMDFCSKAFGYRAKPGCCPCSNVNDYEALSRLIEAIEAECAKHSKTYKFDDRVIFTVDGKDYKYTVRDAWLSNSDGRNDEIFSVLELDAKEFCTKAYGYPAEGGSWPECHDQDFDALNRVIKALQEEIAKRPVETASIKVEDKIVFSGDKLSAPIKYEVRPKFLYALVGNNDRLFKELKMDQPEKVAYCSKAYGYDAKNLRIGSWPEYTSNDYKVLPKLFDNLIADYGLTITINDKPYKGSKTPGNTKYAEATTEDIKTLAELKRKLDESRLLDRVPSITKDLLYSNLSRITSTTPIVFTLKDKTFHYTFNPSWLSVNGSYDGGNSALFRELGIRNIAQDLATACYGYKAGGGAWPDYHFNDKKALLRFLYVLSKEYDVKISIDGAPLGSYVWSSLTGCATSSIKSDEITSSEESETIDLTAEIFDDDDVVASKATCAMLHPYDAKTLETQATTLVDRSKLLNHRSPEISLTINHFSLKF